MPKIETTTAIKTSPITKTETIGTIAVTIKNKTNKTEATKIIINIIQITDLSAKTTIKTGK